MKKPKLTYANVMATIAVFITLGGTGYAAVKIKGNQIKNRTISAKKIKIGSLTSKEVRSAKVSNLTRQLTISNPRAQKRGASASANQPSAPTIVRLSVGETKSLLEIGPFRMTVVCSTRTTEGGDQVPATGVRVGTSVDGTLVAGVSDDQGIPDDELDAGEEGWAAAPGQALRLMASPEHVILAAPNGQVLNSRFFYGQSGLGSDCFASAYAIG